MYFEFEISVLSVLKYKTCFSLTRPDKRLHENVNSTFFVTASITNKHNANSYYRIANRYTPQHMHELNIQANAVP